MRIEVHLLETSQPVIHENVVNAYTKGPLYCVYVDGAVFKYPVDHIWRVRETYR